MDGIQHSSAADDIECVQRVEPVNLGYGIMRVVDRRRRSILLIVWNAFATLSLIPSENSNSLGWALRNYSERPRNREHMRALVVILQSISLIKISRTPSLSF